MQIFTPNIVDSSERRWPCAAITTRNAVYSVQMEFFPYKITYFVFVFNLLFNYTQDHIIIMCFGSAQHFGMEWGKKRFLNRVNQTGPPNLVIEANLMCAPNISYPIFRNDVLTYGENRIYRYARHEPYVGVWVRIIAAITDTSFIKWDLS